MSRHRGSGFSGLLVCALVVALSAAACGTDVPASGSASASPTVVPASPSAVVIASPTPIVSPTIEATATPTPVAPTISPDASPAPTQYAGPGAICTGSSENKAYWTQAAAWLTFDVYCPVLPAGWILTASEFTTKNGGVLTATYAGKAGAKIKVQEGAFCTSGLSACSAHDVVLGTAKFAERPGSLDTLGPSLGYAIYVNPGASPAYAITGTGLTQDQFVAIAAALAKVPRG